MPWRKGEAGGPQGDRSNDAMDNVEQWTKKHLIPNTEINEPPQWCVQWLGNTDCSIY